ncbi:hypothetical protein PV396_24435 [Streptomyces sp. ME02-8801-2C]|uniref:hypothetical protein n=1 Tax=Streptomyces sp. ME02-8801-2C TaxID=3028680 RepID=UPI0029ADAD52|nr:hypothetical protein [Streptomyces sp. ME02-8801-2C]MDX3455050.1 hypothetical protein [Streptomyces sp. ME02-8801-2C]
MATPPETPEGLGQARYEQVAATIRAIIEQIQQIWRTLSAATIEEDLLGEPGAAIAAAAVAGQASVADAAQAYIASQMAVQGALSLAQAALSPTLIPPLIPSAFTGVAPGGGPLETLLYLPSIGVRRRLAAGLPPEEAMIGGLVDMTMYVQTAIADAARTADQVAMAVNPSCVAYVRVVRLPACARCIILSGQMYTYSEGFLRHPNCDCQTLPLREHEWPQVLSPQKLFEQLDKEQQQRVFTVAGARAIRAGGDIGQVVNARRGMDTARIYRRTLQVTHEGATRRSVYGRSRDRAGDQMSRFAGQRHGAATSMRYFRSTRTPRLMPEEIFRIADDDRDEELRLLRRYGYVL